MVLARDRVLVAGRMSARVSSLGRGEYSCPEGISRMNGKPARARHTVPIARSRMSFPMSSSKTKLPMDAKTKALSPKADSGNAVAVPRCSGQLNVEVLIAAVKAVQLPIPVKKVHRQLM